MLIEIVVVIKI